jgi:hypothetical protein
LPVRIRSKTRLQSSVTPSDLNTETDIVNLGDQSDDFILEGQISLQNMTSEDVVVLRIYLAVDGVNRVKSDEMSFSREQNIPVVKIPATTLAYNSKPRITVTQTSGTTLKSFPYSIIYQVMEVI